MLRLRGKFPLWSFLLSFLLHSWSRYGSAFSPPFPPSGTKDFYSSPSSRWGSAMMIIFSLRHHRRKTILLLYPRGAYVYAMCLHAQHLGALITASEGKFLPGIQIKTPSQIKENSGLRRSSIRFCRSMCAIHLSAPRNRSKNLSALTKPPA